MLDYLVQLISIIVLILVIINRRIDERLSRPNIQILLAVITMLIFVFIDPLAGFVLVIALFILYYKTMYVTSHKADVNNNEGSLESSLSYQETLRKANVDSIYNSYITPEHLDSAQNNVVGDLNQPILPTSLDVKMSNTQGLDNEMPGYDYAVFQELE